MSARKRHSSVPISVNTKEDATNMDCKKATENISRLAENVQYLVNENEVFDDEHWRACKYMLIVAGLWPYKKRSFNVSLRFFYIFTISTMMIPEIIRAFEEMGRNSNVVLESIIGVLYFQICIVKYINNFYRIDKLQYLYELIMKHLNEYTVDEEQNIFRKFSKTGRTLIIGYGASISLGCFWYSTIRTAVPAFLDLVYPLNAPREKRLCKNLEYFVDEESYFYYLFVHNIICVLCSAIIYSAVDGSYVCIVKHSVALFKITAYRLRQSFEFKQNYIDIKSKEIETKIHNYVISSIAVHNKSIQFANLLQTTYTMSFFLSTMATLIGISLGVALLMKSMHDATNLIKLFLMAFGIILNLFCINMQGQQILDASSKISYSIYSCCWYEFPVKTQCLLKYMMLRCALPCKLVAGPLFCLNLETFGWIMKTAMSYVAVVLRVND